MTASPLPSQLMERVARYATWRPGGTSTVAPEDRLPVILLVVGSVLMPLGLVFILLGWWGASKTPFGFEQIPYLISGGLLGLGFMFAGGFLFFASWLARVAVTSQRTSDQIAALTARLDGQGLGAANDNGSNVGSSASGSTSAPRTATSGTLVATATGTMLHRSDCPIVASRDNIRTVAAKEQEKLQPCQICDPLSA
jgi:hypothetical protein